MALAKGVVVPIFILVSLTSLVLVTTYFEIAPKQKWLPRISLNTFYSNAALLLKSVDKVPVDYTTGQDALCSWEKQLPRQLDVQNKTKKWILIYTTLFGDNWGPGVKVTENNLSYLKCIVDNCQVTYDKSIFAQASAVVFHARDMPSAGDLWALSKIGRPRWQRWAYHISESPLNTPHVEPLNGLFNLTMTYELDSDIFMPYRRFRRLKPEEPRPEKSFNYADGKTKMMAWLVSNCGVHYRNNIARELESRGIEVSVGGGCRSAWPHQLKCDGLACKGLAAHRFYFAAENTFCKDYASDKYWYHPFENNMIPVVIGGADYGNPCLVIPGSYISTLDFSGVDELSAYLKLVAANDTLFNSYFEWKQHYDIYPLSDAQTWPHAGNFLCELCRIAQDDRYPERSYATLGTLRNANRDCIVEEKSLAIWRKAS